MDLMQEIRLYENSIERERVDNMSELYSVLNALECLEKVFSRDCILPKEYTAECSKLLVALRLVEGANVEEFVKKYRIHCPAALERIREDRPITVKDDKGNTQKCIAETVASFITFLDQLKLNIRAVDELSHILNDLYVTIYSISALPDDFDAKKKIKYWHDHFKTMTASDEITDETARQIIFDIESAYNSFMHSLQNT